VKRALAAFERVYADDGDVIAYLESDINRCAIDIWNLRFESNHHEFYVARDRGTIRAHLGIFHAPEADYVTLGGHDEGVGRLLTLIPDRAVVLVPPAAFEAARPRMKPGIVYSSDLMLVRRGEETVGPPGTAVRLTEKDAEEYAGFGASFNAPPVPVEWARERISRDAVFGVFEQGKLASIASAMAFHPEVAVIMGVETRKEFRRRGYGRSVVSAAVREALDRSKSCTLWVASRNSEAQPMYRSLGFRKVGEELWVDIGTGVTP
jgi:ribosomal protein S18 acetylase RimI-like enzyme